MSTPANLSLPPNLDLARDWTGQVLSFAMENAARPEPVPPAAPAALERMAAMALRLLQGSGRQRLVLVGLGSGALLEQLAASLPGTPLLCLEPEPERARAWFEQSRTLPKTAALLADSSPWALACLAQRCGFGPDRAVSLLNPECGGQQVQETRRLLARLRHASRHDSRHDSGPAASEGPTTPLSELSCAAILSPDEPDLDAFCQQFPDGIRELVLVWDGERVPDIEVPKRFPVRQSARPLGRDFAAQRNRMLAACTGSWVLSLDADERLAPGLWDHLPGLLRPEWAGVLLPRLTLYPDEDHFRMGFGLWPDLQLRLFRKTPGLRYERPIHERLAGLDGPLALLPDRPILHLTHLAKRAEAIRDKLAGFNEVWADSGGATRHTLNQDFPSLEAAPPFLPADPASSPEILLLGSTKGAGQGRTAPGE